MSNIKELRGRIKSTGSTLKLTNAMGLVASSKIRRAFSDFESSREYFNSIESLFSTLSKEPECKNSRCLSSDGERCKIIVIAGDRGLAGGYNSGIFKLMREFDGSEFIPIGKRVCDRLNTEVISSEYFDVNAAEAMAAGCLSDFESESFDRLGIIYTKFISPMKYEADIKWLLPFSPVNMSAGDAIIYEPDAMTVFKATVKHYLKAAIFFCVRESFVSEVYARRFAMDNAGKNAQEMIDGLKLEYNSARQSIITREINEIVSGAEA